MNPKGADGMAKQCRPDQTDLGTPFAHLGTLFAHLGTLFAHLGSVFARAHLSENLGSLWYQLYSLPSVIVHTIEKKYLQDQLANFSHILSVASFGWGKSCIKFWGKLDQNWLPWQQKAPIDI